MRITGRLYSGRLYARFAGNGIHPAFTIKDKQVEKLSFN
ncbi:hypothetical protein ABIE06_001722 [Pantoea dispersa]